MTPGRFLGGGKTRQAPTPAPFEKEKRLLVISRAQIAPLNFVLERRIVVPVKRTHRLGVSSGKKRRAGIVKLLAAGRKFCPPGHQSPSPNPTSRKL